MTDLTKIPESQLIKTVEDSIQDYKDWPKPGIVFKDVFAAFANNEAFQALMELFRRKGSIRSVMLMINVFIQ